MDCPECGECIANGDEPLDNLQHGFHCANCHTPLRLAVVVDEAQLLVKQSYPPVEYRENRIIPPGTPAVPESPTNV